MRTVELITILATFIAAIVSALTSIEQRLIKKFSRKPDNPENDPLPSPELRPLSKLVFSRLKKSNVLFKTETGEYYFNESAYRSFRKKRAAVIITFILVSISLIFIFN
ncbi:MAG: hypothetical protein JW995_04290 [Melioribacteraceae bacterium]|nr:hypothetical protein [Melioribacteraceae bacterium]